MSEAKNKVAGKGKVINTMNKIMSCRYFNHLMVLLLVASITGNFALCARGCKTDMKIVKVDVELLVRKLVKNVAEQKQEDTEKATKERLAKVDALLHKLAAQENFIILPTKAVVAGGIDITAQVETLLEYAETSVEEKRKVLFKESLRVTN